MKMYQAARSVGIASLLATGTFLAHAQPAWQRTADYPLALFNMDVVEAGGRLYVAAGLASNAVADVYFGSLASDGSVSSWASTTPLPQADPGPGLAAAAGWLYAALTNGAIVRAPIEAGGGLGAWIAETNTVDPSSSYSMALRAHSGRLYLFGRWENGPANVVRIAPINPDGSVGAWQVGSLPMGLFRPAAHFYNNRAYLAGGYSSIMFGNPISPYSYSAPVNPDGTLGAWRQEADVPVSVWMHCTALVSNEVYVLGGFTNVTPGAVNSMIYRGSIQSPDGAITNWTEVERMPTRHAIGVAAVYAESSQNLYLVGGADAMGQFSSEVWRKALGTNPPVNLPPTAHSQTVSATAGTTTPITLTGTDPEDAPLTFLVLQAPTNGTLSGTAPNLTYQPNAGYSGPDALLFKVNDGQNDSAPALVTITVLLETNTAPTAGFAIGGVMDFPGFADPVAISGDGQAADLLLDGTGSTDPDGGPLQFQWLADGAAVGQGPVIQVALAVGSHTLTLIVSDGQATGTNQAQVAIITRGQAIETLAAYVRQSDLPTRRKPPLLASLNAAAAAVDRGNDKAADNQLHAFQQKVDAQVARLDPELASELIRLAEAIIQAEPSHPVGSKIHRAGVGGGSLSTWK